MECSLAVKKNEILKSVEKKWKDLECIILNEVTQFQRSPIFPPIFRSSGIIYTYECKQMYSMIQCNTSEAEQGRVNIR